MSKQSKITIKHYLEKRLKLRDFTYPVYCYITYQRKTTKFKSFTGIYLSEAEFEKYTNNTNFEITKKEFKNFNKDIQFNQTIYNKIRSSNKIFILEKEIKSIYFILENFIDREYIFENNFIYNIGFFFEKLDTNIITFFWEKYTLKENKLNNKINVLNYNKLVYSLNQERNLIEIIEDIKSTTSIDLKEYFNKETLIKWRALKVILYLYENYKIIDLFIDYNSNNLEIESKLIKLNIDKNIFDEVINDYYKNIKTTLSTPLF